MARAIEPASCPNRPPKTTRQALIPIVVDIVLRNGCARIKEMPSQYATTQMPTTASAGNADDSSSIQRIPPDSAEKVTSAEEYAADATPSKSVSAAASTS